MDRSTALKKLGRILGRNMGYRVDPTAPKQEERDAARAALVPGIERRQKLTEQREARAKAILAADPEYQRLKAEEDAARKENERLRAITQHFKITVGVTRAIFFEVKAQGDSWEQIIEKLSPKRDAA